MENKYITSESCAKFLELPLIGEVININRVSDINFKGSGDLKFLSVCNQQYIDTLNMYPKNFVIASRDCAGLLNLPHVLSENPRLDFVRVCHKFFPRTHEEKIESSASIGNNVKLGCGVYIGKNVVIEDNVVIGDFTVVMHNVVISTGTHIGSSCMIKSGSVIGQKGFGFERGADGVPIEFVHFGKVIIGDHVEIGALNTIVAGALSDTVINDYVKTDDHVHVAHNVFIGSKTLVAACSEISGSVNIGKECWIAPNSSIIDKVNLGDRVFVGIGSVVTKSFASDSVVVGVPARLIRSS